MLYIITKKSYNVYTIFRPCSHKKYKNKITYCSAEKIKSLYNR